MATGPSPSAAGRQLISRAGLSKGLLNRFLSVAVRLVSSRLACSRKLGLGLCTSNFVI